MSAFTRPASALVADQIMLGTDHLRSFKDVSTVAMLLAKWSMDTRFIVMGLVVFILILSNTKPDVLVKKLASQLY